MEKRKLGRSGLDIPRLVVGGNVFGWTADEKMSFTLLDAFLDSGCNFIDTADIYSTWAPGNRGGESETIIGRWMKLRHNRNRVIIATKVGMEMGPGKKGLSKGYILRAVEDSLKRLQTDRIDLYFSHEDDPTVPIEETLEAFSILINEGKVRVIGASNLLRQEKVKAVGATNFTGERLEQALQTSARLGFPRYECIQPQYNLYDRAEYEQNLEPVCIKQGIGVVTYFSLASGFLTGKYRSEKDLKGHPRGGMVQQYLNKRGIRILEALDQVAEQTCTSPTQVALAWLMARPGVTAPIASATTLEQVKELTQSMLLHLDKKCIDLLDKASAYS